MAERRSLIEGVRSATPPVDPKLEKDFVFQGQARGDSENPTPHPVTPTVPRSPLSTRVRTDYAKALKRASLDRQLKGVEPFTLCDILEQAIEPWLKANGYLS